MGEPHTSAEPSGLDETRYLDDTTIRTISYLESRLGRLEHLLNGRTSAIVKKPAIPSLQQLEHRFEKLRQQVRTYDELLRIYNAHPTLFVAPSTGAAPESLPPAALAQMVLASSTMYPSTASQLTSIKDTPIPDPSLTANLVTLVPRMKAIEATQKAQSAEVADLRRRSEQLVRNYYEQSVVGYGNRLAGAEKRVERVERAVKQAEKANEDV
ncbi:nuclear distribution protein [Pestalotiopsis sp. NC0098]|nr:nuclear distribution protein [Pestalotiopsis sp. NC0098]